MREFSKEELEYYKEKIAEAERSIELYGTKPIEDFWRRVEELEKKDRRERQLKRKNIKLNMMKPFSKIMKKYIRA